MNQTTQPRRPKLFIRTIYLFRIILFFFTLNSGSPAQTGWYQQTLPMGGTIYDMQFIDANTGWISLFNPFGFIKTTSGGSNWTVISSGQRGFGQFDFLNDTVGYIVGTDDNFNGTIRKTSDGGLNWTLIYTGVNTYDDLSFISNDTGYFSGIGIEGAGGIWKTTNGGLTYERLYLQPLGISKIFFLKKPYDGEYYGWWLGNGYMGKTTNSGVNWSEPTNSVNGENGQFRYFYFINRDTGWVVFRGPFSPYYRLCKTTDGGNDWTVQYGADPIFYSNTQIDAVSPERLWTGCSEGRIVFATTDGGIHWGTQSVPPNFDGYFHMDAIDSLTAWTGGSNPIAHTTDGGGVITYIGSDPSNTATPGTFALNQNYPNPFNSQTVITFSIPVSCRVSLKVYDMLGKEVIGLFEVEALSAGNYRAALDFGKGSLPSGTYILNLRVRDNTGGELFSKNRRMMYLK